MIKQTENSFKKICAINVIKKKKKEKRLGNTVREKDCAGSVKSRNENL